MSGSSRNLNGIGHNPGGGVGPPTPKPPKGSSPGGSPGLLTSTGGLFGNTGALLIPYMDTLNDRFFAAFIDQNNFDTENDGYYFFRQEDVIGDGNPGGERVVTVHRAVITYREIGVAQFTFGVRVYSELIDDYSTVEKIFKITKPTDRLSSQFPDFKLHTRKISFVITGIRPQAYITRKADKGPFSITKVKLLIDAQETPEA